jgi:hypothetical protein
MPATDIERVREIISDFYDSNPVANENLSRQVDGSNTKFYVQEFRQRVGKSVWNTTLSDSGSGFKAPFSISFDTTINVAASSYDTTLGWFIINPAPVNTCRADYYFQRFSDTDINNYLGEALNFLNGGYQTIDSAPVEHQSAAIQYAAFLAWKALASRASELAKQQLGQASADLDNLANKWAKQATEAMNHAIYLRDDYYKRSGQREAPTMGYIRLDQDVGTWTPQR